MKYSKKAWLTIISFLLISFNLYSQFGVKQDYIVHQDENRAELMKIREERKKSIDEHNLKVLHQLEILNNRKNLSLCLIGIGTLVSISGLVMIRKQI